MEGQANTPTWQTQKSLPVWESVRLPQSPELPMVPQTPERPMGIIVGDHGGLPQTPPEVLPGLGMAGTALPGAWLDAHPQWQKMTELPKRNIPRGEAWERNVIFTVWVKGSS